MSETQKHSDNKEYFTTPENEQTPEHQTAGPENMYDHRERQGENRPSIERLTKLAETHAQSAVEHRTSPEQPKDDHPVLIGKQLKDMAYERTMLRVRKQLSPPARLFSKIAHSPFIDRPSELIGKTIAKPSITLGGALTACIGATAFLWAAKRYGYEYNYLAAILLFILGGLAGLAAESIVKFLKRSR